MLERLGARAAMRRSRELVEGHRKDVFLVLVNIWIRTGIVWILCTLLIGAFASGTAHPALAIWFGGVLAAAFITPYAAHALNVVYYRLTEPDQPLLPKTDPAWDSVWREHDATQS